MSFQRKHLILIFKIFSIYILVFLGYIRADSKWIFLSCPIFIANYKHRPSCNTVILFLFMRKTSLAFEMAFNYGHNYNPQYRLNLRPVWFHINNHKVWSFVLLAPCKDKEIQGAWVTSQGPMAMERSGMRAQLPVFFPLHLLLLIPHDLTRNYYL